MGWGTRTAISAVGYHLFNVGVHAVCALLLFGLLRRSLALPYAFGAALLWTVHPLNTDALNHVIYRSETLMACFYLATLYLVARGSDSKRPALWYAAAVAACALGMGSKEAMVSAPLCVLVYDRTFLAGSFAGAWRARPSGTSAGSWSPNGSETCT